MIITNMFGIELIIGPVATTIFLGLATVVLVYWYSTRNHDYWKKRGIPYVKPLPLFGNILDNITQLLHEVDMKRYRTLGPMYGVFLGSKPFLTVGDPFLIREIMVKDFQYFTTRGNFDTGNKLLDSALSNLSGEDWKRVRTIITPTFTTGKIKKMLSIFDDCAKTVVQNFKTVAQKGDYADLKKFYGAFSMDVIASSAFSTKIDSHSDPDNPFVRNAKTAFKPRPLAFLVLLMPRLMKLLGINFSNMEPFNFFETVTLEIIEERKRTGQVRNDFLQLLLDTAKEVSEEQKWESQDKEKEDVASNYGEDVASNYGEDVASNYGEDDTTHKILKNVSSKNLSMTELVAQCIIFFLAGYDTTASTLAFASYFLALNQDVQDKLRAEVDAAVKENNGELTYEAIQGMKYLDNVISETLRYFPPAVANSRKADADYKLGDTGLTIPKDMSIIFPVFAIHHDPKYYPNPERFDPDRFTPEERAKRDPYVFLPFGAGPRNCVGMRFALIEIKVCIARVIANFKVKTCPRTQVPLKFERSTIGLLQPQEIMVEMEIRKDTPLSN